MLPIVFLGRILRPRYEFILLYLLYYFSFPTRYICYRAALGRRPAGMMTGLREAR